ncbi:MAG: hypothetical protein ACK4FV_00465 [Candidatus Nitrosocaldus sp.]
MISVKNVDYTTYDIQVEVKEEQDLKDILARLVEEKGEGKEIIEQLISNIALFVLT